MKLRLFLYLCVLTGSCHYSSLLNYFCDNTNGSYEFFILYLEPLAAQYAVTNSILCNREWIHSSILHNWQLWKFGTTIIGYWENITNQRQFLDWLAQELNFQV